MRFTETYLETTQKTYDGAFFCENITIFAKSSIVDFRLGSKYASVSKVQNKFLKETSSKFA